MDGAINLALYGQYAMRSWDGFRVLDQPLIANGPGVVLPLAVAFHIFGVGIGQARLVAALFMFIGGVSFFWISRRLTGTAGALIALAMLIALPHEGYLYLGRMAIGSVPGLAYFLVGGVAWLLAVQKKSLPWALAAGIVFGVAAVTKGQYSLVIFPALAMAWLTDELWLKRLPRHLYAAAIVSTGVVLAGWYAARLLIVGPEGFVQHLAAVQSATRSTVLALDPLHYSLNALVYLAKSGIGLVWLLGMAFAVWRVWRRYPGAETLVLFGSMSSIWMAWYLLLSNGWARYAFDAFALACLMAGGAVIQAWGAVRNHWQMRSIGGGAHGWHASAKSVAVVAVGAITVGTLLLTVVQGTRRVNELTTPTDTSTSDFAAYLDAHVSQGAKVETWEWQLTVFTRRVFSRPETVWVDRYTEAIFSGRALAEQYDLGRVAPDYVVDGPFSKWTGIYAADLKANCCDLVATIGPYDLYRAGQFGWTTILPAAGQYLTNGRGNRIQPRLIVR